MCRHWEGAYLFAVVVTRLFFMDRKLRSVWTPPSVKITHFSLLLITRMAPITFPASHKSALNHIILLSLSTFLSPGILRSSLDGKRFMWSSKFGFDLRLCVSVCAFASRSFGFASSHVPLVTVHVSSSSPINLNHPCVLCTKLSVEVNNWINE